jgi:hypothetical protein
MITILVIFPPMLCNFAWKWFQNLPSNPNCVILCWVADCILEIAYDGDRLNLPPAFLSRWALAGLVPLILGGGFWARLSKIPPLFGGEGFETTYG